MNHLVRVVLTVGSVIAILGLGGADAQQSSAPTETRTVRFSTEDGVEIAGLLRLTSSDAPTIICLPMYRSGKEAYEPLFDLLTSRGCNVLSIDLRGHGESKKPGEDLAAQVVARNAELFRSMHRDVEAALGFLEREHGIDSTRVGLIGASVGCSVAVHTTALNRGQIRAIALLTPGAAYLGVDTLSHLSDWDAPPTLILTAQDEEANVRNVVDAISAHDSTELTVYPGRRMHGTRMFGKARDADGITVEQRIVDFFLTHLGDSPDIRIPHFAEGHPSVGTAGFVRRTLRARRMIGDDVYELMAFAVGSKLTLGAMVKQPFSGKVRFSVQPDGRETPLTITAPFVHPRRDGATTGAALSASADSVSLEPEQASAGPWGWISVELDIARWHLDSGSFAIALEYEGANGNVVLPAQPAATAGSTRPPAATHAAIDAVGPQRVYRGTMTRHALPETPAGD